MDITGVQILNRVESAMMTYVPQFAFIGQERKKAVISDISMRFATVMHIWSDVDAFTQNYISTVESTMKWDSAALIRETWEKWGNMVIMLNGRPSDI